MICNVEFAVIAIFFTRAIRMFAYGAVAVVFLLYLKTEFASSEVTGILMGILLGDWVVSLALTSYADRIGRRLTLCVAAALFASIGVAFYLTTNVPAVAIVGILGIVSPAAGEIGPFISIEQAALSDAVGRRPKSDAASLDLVPLTQLLAWYQLCGGIFAAVGALASGLIVSHLEIGYSNEYAYRCIFLGYAIVGGVLAVAYAALPADVEPQPKAGGAAAASATNLVNAPSGEDDVAHEAFRVLGLKRASTVRNVFRVSFLFSVDAFAGGLVIQTYISWWFHVRWSLDPKFLGSILLGVNVIGGLSGLVAGRLVAKFGAVNTMVFTHFPSNILLALVVAMPTQWSAVLMILLRYTISQMDVPARQAYTAGIVPADERAAGNGVTNSIRSIGVALSALVLIPCTASSDPVWQGAPYIISGVLKCIYDIAVKLSFPKVANKVAPPTSTQVVVDAGAAATINSDRNAETSRAEKQPLLKPSS